ncbi:unnamed protein product [Bursaphelenchus xylophilus]|uniref:(pine wood nematode) hypothetical protein n=1 Tax=Bursaphelenchus xylophilus TaxID=6326 RepID=A0A7I8XDC7_BURXY|nr:unnamed protein product [Bursaphelenchus xylophilus]CAG9114015.1 unnamed protein product [Bursaphelenchus xylophilus]
MYSPNQPIYVYFPTVQLQPTPWLFIPNSSQPIPTHIHHVNPLYYAYQNAPIYAYPRVFLLVNGAPIGYPNQPVQAQFHQPNLWSTLVDNPHTSGDSGRECKNLQPVVKDVKPNSDPFKPGVLTANQFIDINGQTTTKSPKINKGPKIPLLMSTAQFVLRRCKTKEDFTAEDANKQLVAGLALRNG